jgi:hypothetical protein
MTSPDKLRIANSTASGTSEANGIIDEFRIYNSDDAPGTLALGGNTAATGEYLNDSADDYTFSFVAVDAQKRGEYLFLGSDSKFTGVNVDLQTLGVEGTAITFTWQYWNGTAWSALTVTEGQTGTSSFEASGSFYWSAPADWAIYSVNGSTDLYYIRGYLASGSYSTSPVENLLRTDIVTLHYLSDVTAADASIYIGNPRFLRHGSFVPADGLKREKQW